MNIIEPSFEFMDIINGAQILTNIERIGRVCYKTEDKIT
jgi:thymidylate synthase (FAD)